MVKNKTLFLILLAVVSGAAAGGSDGAAEYFAGQDLRFSATSVTVYEDEKPSDHVLIFDGHFSMEIGDNRLCSDGAIVWLKTIGSGSEGIESVDYTADIFLEGDVSVARGKLSRTSGLSETVVEQGASLLVSFYVSGEVFVTAENHNTSDMSVLGYQRIYRNALEFVSITDDGIVIDPKVIVSPLDEGVAAVGSGNEGEFSGTETGSGAVDSVAKDGVSMEPKYRYPVNIAGVWEKAPDLEVTTLADGSKIATLTGRFYIWQKKNEFGDLVEFQADNAVLFYGGDRLEEKPEGSQQGVLASGSVTSVYLQGNIVMTEGSRTVRADELFYDFENSRALAVNAEMHKFDEKRGIPVYLRAVKLRQVSENLFEAEDITLTTSEFYLPQISMTASKLVLTDLTGVDERAGKIADDSKYDVLLTDVKLKVGKRPIFWWSKIRTDFERPDLPIRRASVGNDSDFGTTVQTEWYLAKILGLKEPAGTDSSLNLDYFSERGFGAGAVVDYGQQDYYGGVSGYIVKDRGLDDLGRTESRKNLDSGNEYRGRFTSRHRQYLPYDWQATFEVSYISDKNFLESFYRNEFNTSKAQETLLHLKRLKDNWAFSFLSKARINDFETMTEELPTMEYHLTGQSLWDNRLTYYTDTRVSRLRDRIDNDTVSSSQQQFYTFFVTRHELDMPLKTEKFSIVPFIAGSYGYEDGEGFDTRLDGTDAPMEDKAFLGETGVRVGTMFWKEMANVQSKFWDVDGLRHIVKPHAELTTYFDNDETIEMRDTYNVGLSQRLQTQRGRKGDKRTVDWMRFDVDATFLGDRADSSTGPAGTYGPAKFIFNDPSTFFLTRRDDGRFGMVRDSVNADYSWRITDTTTVLSDFNYDTESGVFQQVDVGMSRYVYPDINYYIGSRYLRPSIVSIPTDGVYEEGSQTVIASIAYKLNERYTAMFSQEYNADYGKNVRSEIALLRRYHRLYYSLSLATDESLDRDSIMFSIWPQGVKELSFGKRKYISLSEWTAEE